MTLTHTVDTALLDFFTKRAGPEAIVDPELAKVVVGLLCDQRERHARIADAEVNAVGAPARRIAKAIRGKA